jgi:hypothetical protein
MNASYYPQKEKIMKKNITKKSRKKTPHQEVTTISRERKYWTMRVQPSERITLGENITQCLMIVQNHGPGKIEIEPGYGKPVVLLPDQVRLVSTFYNIFVESKDEDPALIEFEFMPTER